MWIDWQKSTFSEDRANCVYLAADSDGTILLRESDQPETIVTTDTAGLSRFITAVKQGDFDTLD